MENTRSDLTISELSRVLFEGIVIPAMPLALKEDRSFNETRQKALLRYYIDAGAGGVAVGVHTTQFEIRKYPGLLESVLRTASQTIDSYTKKRNIYPFVKIAGICGNREAGFREAGLARQYGYNAGLLNLSNLKDSGIDDLLLHCRRIAQVIPVVGFYLQEAVGGRELPFQFWKDFVQIENVTAVKIAAFDRYKTLDVLRAICEAGKEREIAVYTGNDDNIVVDLLTGFTFNTSRGVKSLYMRGGLLGHWSVWTKPAVELLERIKEIRHQIEHGTVSVIPAELLTIAAKITDANGALFDAANNFKGCIPGLHEVLRRQGLFEGIWCLNPGEMLSIGQLEEIDRIYRSYPELHDDDFVKAHLASWLHG